MSQELIKAERAALIQAVKALYIPLSLFVACVISAGGMYMVLYTDDKSPGYAFLAVAFTIIISAFVALIRFQNNYRVKGMVGREEAAHPEDILVDAEKEQNLERGQVDAVPEDREAEKAVTSAR
ncbi:MAG: hypothetical protein IT342_16240 [Candidatus Melainabacteria bacterium]|nr:hypothetical protein [Candidatus Melainabacteria bacterium]